MAKQYQYEADLAFALDMEDMLADFETDELAEQIAGDIADIHLLREKNLEDEYVLKCDGTW